MFCSLRNCLQNDLSALRCWKSVPFYKLKTNIGFVSQDGMSPQCANVVCEAVNEKFPRRWIERGLTTSLT